MEKRELLNYLSTSDHNFSDGGNISMEKMSGETFLNRKKGTPLEYSLEESSFGNICIASINGRICYLGLVSTTKSVIIDLTKRFPYYEAVPTYNKTAHKNILEYLNSSSRNNKILLSLYGTEFQYLVWRELLKIPYGSLATYGQIAERIGIPNGCRAVGSAVGKNPVSLLIPCHRVIRNNGGIGGYYWGIEKNRNFK